jgi:hypothetical protein
VQVSTVGVATLGVDHPTSCHIASRGSTSLHSVSCVGVRTMVVATLGACQLASCRMATRCSSSAYSDCVDVGKICVRLGCLGLG